MLDATVLPRVFVRREEEKGAAGMGRLIGGTLLLLLRFLVRTVSDLLGCGVRLLYWSIRRYGWGRVTSFFVSAWLSLWLHASLALLAITSVSLASILATTLMLWGVLLGFSMWLNRRWLRWRVGVPSPALPLLPHPHRDRELPPGDTVAAPRARTELWDCATSLEKLQQAWRRVRTNGGAAGSDGQTVEAFSESCDQLLSRLHADLQSGRYRPAVPRWIDVAKQAGGVRRIGVLCLRDRIAQQAVLSVLSPLWDWRFSPCSYAYRPGRSALQAVTEVERALHAGRLWVVDADIRSFFDNVSHPLLFALLDEWLPDASLRALVRDSVTVTAPAPGRGLAQGAPLSPVLSNVYLCQFDRAMEEAGHRLVRYADDFLILCATEAQAQLALTSARRLLDRLELYLHQEKTRILHRDQGIAFLGWTFDREGKRPSEAAKAACLANLAATTDRDRQTRIVTGRRGYFGDEVDVPDDNEELEGLAAVTEQALSNQRVSETDLAAYRRCFLGRTDVFARYWQRDRRQGYVPVRRVLTDEELKAHLWGSAVLGTYLFHPDGQLRTFVLDIDGADYFEKSRAAAYELTEKLARSLCANGLTPIWEDSGGKGYHLWLCFSGFIEPARTLRWVEKWLDGFRPFPPGVMVELFPRQAAPGPSSLGPLIRLPLGRHPKTGRWSILLTQDGKPASEPVAFLMSVPLLAPELPSWSGTASPADGRLPSPPAAVAAVITGCSLLSALVAKAVTTHHLRHTERLALLYTLGHLGEAGRTYLHQVIGLCSNYDPRITERWIRRLEEGHRPIRCSTLKTWLKDHLPGVDCPCIPGAANPSPLHWAGQSRRSLTPDPDTTSPDRIEGWTEVVQDLFGNSPDYEGQAKSGPTA